jgi:hypothetical protein
LFQLILTFINSILKNPSIESKKTPTFVLENRPIIDSAKYALSGQTQRGCSSLNRLLMMSILPSKPSLGEPGELQNQQFMACSEALKSSKGDATGMLGKLNGTRAELQQVQIQPRNVATRIT